MVVPVSIGLPLLVSGVKYSTPIGKPAGFLKSAE